MSRNRVKFEGAYISAMWRAKSKCNGCIWKVRVRDSKCGKIRWSAILIRDSVGGAGDGGRWRAIAPSIRRFTNVSESALSCNKNKFDNLNSNTCPQKSDSIQFKHFREALTASALMASPFTASSPPWCSASSLTIHGQDRVQIRRLSTSTSRRRLARI